MNATFIINRHTLPINITLQQKVEQPCEFIYTIKISYLNERETIHEYSIHELFSVKDLVACITECIDNDLVIKQRERKDRQFNEDCRKRRMLQMESNRNERHEKLSILDRIKEILKAH